MTANINARDVLKVINSCGYTNLSKKELKEFTNDLKVLMKFELKPTDVDRNRDARPTTARNRSLNRQRTRSLSRENKRVKQSESADTKLLKNQNNTKIQRNSDDHQVQNFRQSKQNVKRASTGSQPRLCVRNTPLDLYQKYKKDWDRFKNYIPGESKRMDTRSAVRKKLRKVDSAQSDTFVYFNNNHKEIVRA